MRDCKGAKRPVRTVLITGASGGLGGALCRAFAAAGDRIGVHVYRNISAGETLVQTLQSAGAEACLFCADLRSADATRQMFDLFWARWGQLDVLINNAAVTDCSHFVNLTEETWDDVLAVNLSGPFFCMREAGRRMSCANGGNGGHIVNIISHAASGRIGQAAYAASKSGLMALTQSAAKEWRTICVNAVAPGLLPTAMTTGLSPAKWQDRIEENALKRTSTFDEVCSFIVGLSHMKHVSGQCFTLDSRILT